ncbi:hypothetical protein QN277_004974 [Acacia crassicarpa]|uniref:Uncharacterized protein n=1 Tax=Acacia crassicarpa TaxID=499986 RepID=A0AAE1M9B7_9FABA|nr:hypothetical protein QN277_004974 [Acacia crassicarpa]
MARRLAQSRSGQLMVVGTWDYTRLASVVTTEVIRRLMATPPPLSTAE